jgi:hypothetical protein
MITWYARRSISPRSRGGIAANGCCAAVAAASASIPSSGPASATSHSALPVAGSSTVRVRPDAAGRHVPPMNRPVGTASITRASSAAELLAAAVFVMAAMLPPRAGCRSPVGRATRCGGVG